MSTVAQAFFAICWWAMLFTAAVLIGSAALWLYVTVDNWRLACRRARRDREQCARMESLRRIADWEWATDAWRFEWSVADDLARLDVREPERVVRP